MEPNPLGRFIKQRRTELGISQRKFAGKIGVASGYMSQIESGERKWPQKYIGAIADELHVTEHTLSLVAGVISTPELHTVEVPPLLADISVWVVQQRDSLSIVGIFQTLEGAEECADCETSFLEEIGKEGAYTITRSTAWSDGTGYHSGGDEKIATYVAGAPSFDIEAKKMLRIIEFVRNGVLSIDYLARYVNYKHEDWVDGLDSRLDQLAWETYGFMKQYSDYPDKVSVSWVVSGIRDAVEKISQEEDVA